MAKIDQEFDAKDLKFFFVVSSHKLAHTPYILVVAHGALQNVYGKVEATIAFVIMHWVCEYVFAIVMVFLCNDQIVSFLATCVWNKCER